MRKIKTRQRGTDDLAHACALILLFIILLLSPVAMSADDSGHPKFDEEIAPLLARRCAGCHNRGDHKGGLDLTQASSLAEGGDSGPAVSPGKPEESLLWQRVEAGEMPPKQKPLAAAEQQLLRSWIAGGAKWGQAIVNPLQFTTDDRAGYDWWSLQPLPMIALPPSVPAIARPDQMNSVVDAFIRAKLSEKNLVPSADAEKRWLVRRLYFDLLGLPPSPLESAEFIDDGRPDAWERLIDRSLASPHFGERWARHWLDVIRFGESQGFERDKLRTNSWRYRDWVVNAFNSDMPYDRFARLQLAGDAIQPGDLESLVATGFLVAGAYDEVGQLQQSSAMRAVVRQDELEDMVASVTQTFLGLTVNCSRCHDHKFDPITQREYYQMAATLSGVRHGERDFAHPEHSHSVDALAIQSTQHRIQQLSERLANIENPIRTQILATRRNRMETSPPPQPLARWEFDGDLRAAVGELHGTAISAVVMESDRIVVDGKSYVVTPALDRDLTEKTLEAWVTLGDLDQRGGGVISLQSLDGLTFDAIVFGELEPGRWLAGSNNHVRSKNFNGTEEKEAAGKVVHVAIVYHADGKISGYRNGQLYGTPYQSSEPITFKSGAYQVAFGIRHAPPGGNRMLRGSIVKAQLYDRALNAEELAASYGVPSESISESEFTERLTPDQQINRTSLKFEISQLQTLQNRWQERKVYAVTSKTPEQTHVLHRGQPSQPGELVEPGGTAAVAGLSPNFELPSDATDAARRLRLADWMTDKRNPLFARVIVNRLWHYHFGTGIVETTNDFGFNGARPSHPELLNWLGTEFLRQGGQLKRLHRELLTSATYRQSSRSRQDCLSVDANNRLLWRKEPMRLEAESIRDAMLSVAGDLNSELYGPGYYDFTTFVHNTQFYDMKDPLGSTFARRSIYRTWVRSGRSPFLDAFDCPDPSTKTPVRAVTTTPLQSLSLLNNSFSLRMADQLAQRISLAGPEDTSEQVALALQLVYGRFPLQEERSVLVQFVQDHGLAALCRVLFNSNEFLYVP